MTSTQPLNPIPPDLLPKLDPRFVKYYNENLANRLGTHQVPLEEVRANPGAWARRPPPDPKFLSNSHIRTWDVSVADTSVPIKARSYHPDESKWGPGPYPLHLNFHGGGWVFGDIDSDAAILLRLREQLPVVFVDVDYRLCPEARFGINAEDAWSALLWTRENAKVLNIDPSSTSIGGISAGAHLACILQHRARDENINIKLLIAAVPPLADHHIYKTASDSPWRSFTEFREVPLLNWDRMAYFQKHAFPADKMREILESIPEWWVSPLRAPNWAGLCDTFVATAECDMLRDEGEAYAKKLVEGGNKVTMRRYKRATHSFMQLRGILPQATQYEEDIVAALRTAHGVDIKV